MDRFPTDMNLPQPKMQMEPPKFTVPDVTLMLENDDSLIINPGMSIPLKFATPDQKPKFPSYSSQQRENDNPTDWSPFRKVVEPQRLGNHDGNLRNKRNLHTAASVTPDNIIGLYKQHRITNNDAERNTFPPNLQNDVDLYIHSPPVISNERRGSPLTVSSNYNRIQDPFQHGLKSVDYTRAQHMHQNRKYYQENNDPYEADRYTDSPRIAHGNDNEKYVRFVSPCDPMDPSIPVDKTVEKVQYTSPKSSNGNAHTFHLYNIIQNQNEQITHLQKVLEKALDQREINQPIDRNYPPVSVKRSMATQTYLEETPLMKCKATNTDMTLDDINSLVELKGRRQCVCKDEINIQKAHHIISQRGVNEVEAEPNVIMSESPTSRNPEGGCLPAVSPNPADITLYDDYHHRQPSEHQPVGETRCTCCVPKGKPEANKCGSIGNEENGNTFYNFRINFQQNLLHGGFGNDRVQDIATQEKNYHRANNSEADRIEIMKQHLLRYKNSFLGLPGTADRKCVQYEPEVAHGNPSTAHKGELVRQAWNPSNPTDGQLAAIAVASAKIRNRVEFRSPPNNQFLERNKSSNSNRYDRSYVRN